MISLFNTLALATMPANIEIPNELKNDPLINNRVAESIKRERELFEHIDGLILKLKDQNLEHQYLN